VKKQFTDESVTCSPSFSKRARATLKRCDDWLPGVVPLPAVALASREVVRGATGGTGSATSLLGLCWKIVAICATLGPARTGADAAAAAAAAEDLHAAADSIACERQRASSTTKFNTLTCEKNDQKASGRAAA